MFREFNLKNELKKNDLKAKVLRGSAYTIFGIGAGQLLRLSSNLILTRILFPEAFGLMALVTVFMQGLGMFSDVGIGPSIIQNKRGDDYKFLNTAWTIQVGRGVCIWIVTCLIAGPFARLYDQPMLAELLPVAGLSAVISGFNSTKIFTANRHLNLGRLTGFDLISQLISVTTVILLAWWLRSVWALVIGNLIGVFAKTLLSQMFLPGKSNRFHWDPTAASALFKFGKWIFVSTLFTFLGRQGDRLVFGALFPIGWLGIYSLATMLMMMVAGVLNKLIRRVAFAAYSKLNYLPAREFRDRLAVSRRRIIIGWAIICATFIILIDPIVRLLWDPRYEDAGWMATILGLSLWPFGLMPLNSIALTSRGEPRFHAFSQIAATISIVTIVPLAFKIGGEIAAVFAVSVGYWAAYIMVFVAAARHKVIDPWTDIIGHLILFSLVGAGVLSRILLGLPAFPW